jgi:hypothetical protein
MMTPVTRLLFTITAVAAMGLAVACNGDDDDATATATTAPATAEASATAAPSATSAPAPTETPPPAPTDTPPPAPTDTPAPAVVDPCTLRDSLEGQPLTAGPSFDLDGSAQWQMCLGGAAAGSSEKYLFGTADGGVSWTLLSMTTLGNPPAEAGVGELPNGNAAEALFFIDATYGWLGLSSPGENLFRSDDGGVTWTFVDVLDPGLPVTSIVFADANNGTLVTPDGDWTTTDGGATWAPAP